MKDKWNRWLPLVFVALFAVSRIPGVLPSNFSAAYAFVFCAGAYFPRRLAWWLPLATMLATDLLLNVFYYHTSISGFAQFAIVNYPLYIAMIWFGRRIGRQASFLAMLGGGLLSAVVFYLITNTLSWLQMPEYAKTFAGWLQAIWTGLPGFPPTWEFFRNTLLSSGLFTAFFAGAAKLTANEESPLEKSAGAREAEPDGAETPEESPA